MTTTTLEPQTSTNRSCAHRVGCVPRSGLREILSAGNAESMISFGGGIPHESCIPLDTIRTAFETVLARHGARAFSYGSSEGEVNLREFIARSWLPRLGLAADPERILIVNGSQQALDLLGKVLIDTATPILVERPTYLAALQAFGTYEPACHEVPLEHDGACPTRMEEALAKNPCRFFYTVPSFQNPSGVCYSHSRRKEIVGILNRHGVQLIEDDPYSQLYFEEPPAPPMSALGAEDAIFLGTFSKIVAPGFRLGWIYAPESVMRHLVTVKQAADLCTGRFQQLLLYETLTALDMERHLQRNREIYRAKRDRFERLLHRYLDGVLRWDKPSGGMFFWASLTGTIPASTFLHACLRAGVAFADGACFHAGAGGTEYLRLNFTQASDEEMERGLKILSEVIGEVGSPGDGNG